MNSLRTQVSQTPADQCKRDHSTVKRKKKDRPQGFLHEANFRNSQEGLELRARGALAWIGAYWSLLEIMRESPTFCIYKSRFGPIARSLDLSLTELTTILDSCLELGLFAENDETIWSPSLDDKMEEFQETRQQRSQAGKASAAKRLDKISTGENSSLNGSFNGPLNEPNIIQLNTTQSNSTEFEGEVQEGKHEIAQTPSEPAAGREPSGEVRTPVPPVFRKPTNATGALAPQNPSPKPSPLQKPDYSTAGALNSVAPAHLDKITLIPESELSTDDLSVFMSCGRRPLSLFPEIYLSPPELKSSLERFEHAGIPPDEFHLIFEDVQRIYKTKPRSVRVGNTAAALTGYVFDNYQKRRKSTLEAKRSEQFFMGKNGKDPPKMMSFAEQERERVNRILEIQPNDYHS